MFSRGGVGIVGLGDVFESSEGLGLVEPLGGRLSSEPDATYLVETLVVSKLAGRLGVF